MTATDIGLIWAQSTSGVIGRDGGIPWRLPEDQARFKELTLGHRVVMGRLTWESLPARVRPLPGRKNVVLTRQAGYMADGAHVVSTLQEALTDDLTWVIGGAQLYSLALPLATRIVGRMLEVPGVTHASYCGSLRRFSETIGDVDIVVAAENAASAEKAMDTQIGRAHV